MRTFEEQLIFDVTGVKTEMYENYQNLTVDKTELTKIIRLAYNQALEDAVKNVSLKETRDSDEYNEMPSIADDYGDVHVIDKQSILGLKKDVSSTD